MDRKPRCPETTTTMALDGYDMVMLGILAATAVLGYFKGMVWQLAWIAGIAAKSLKEVSYHRRFSSEWVKRLGDGTDESRKRMQDAIAHFSLYAGEFFEESPVEKEMAEAGIGVFVASLLPEFSSFTNEVLQAAGLDVSLPDWTQSGGKKGVHSEHLGYILTELQYMQRAYPGMEW